MIVQPFGLLDPIKYAIKTTLKQGLCFLLAIIPFAVPVCLFSLVVLRFPTKLTMEKFIAGQFLTALGLVSLFLGIAVSFFIACVWFCAICANISLAIYDSKPVGLHNVKSTMRNIPVMLKVYGIMFLFLLLLLAVGACLFLLHPALGMLYATLGALLCWPTFMWFMIKTSFSTFAIVDKQCGAIQALTLSYELTRNRFWVLFFIQKFLPCFILPVGIFIAILPVAMIGGAVFGLLQLLIGAMVVYVLQTVFVGIAVCLYFLAFFSILWLMSAYMYRKLCEFQLLMNNSKEDLLAAYMSQQSKPKYGLSE